MEGLCRQVTAVGVVLAALGRADLPVAAVQRERARLVDARHVAGLCGSLDDLRREAAAPYRGRPRSRPLLALAVAAIVATTCAPAASASTAHDPASSCHTFQRFHEIWRLCPDADGSLQRQRIGVLP